MKDFISKSIKLINNSKRYGYYAIQDIPAMSIILIETAKVDLLDNNRYHEMFQILYKIFNNKPQKIKQKFMNLLPSAIKDKCSSLVSYDILRADLMNLEDDTMKKYFLSMNPQELQLYCMKYISNAFGNSEPILLFNGAMFNHSCIPNIKFIQDGNIMYFVTIRDIKSGEELFDNYVNLNLCNQERQKRLISQYGFRCNCNRCESVESSRSVDYYKYRKYIQLMENITLDQCIATY